MNATSTVHRFRSATSHSPRRPAPGGPFDPANEPDRVKRYGTGPLVDLPADWNDADLDISHALAGGKAQDVRPMELRSLARLLFLTGGVTRTFRRSGRVRHFRAAPSAGALYPVEVYVASSGLRDLVAGIHHYDPVAHTLRELRRGDPAEELARAAEDPAVMAAPVSLVFTGIPWRTTWKYGPRGYRHLYWDAGGMIANTLAAAASVGWQATVLVGFVDDLVGELTGLEQQPFRELPLAVVGLGPRLGSADGDGARAGTSDGEVGPLRVSVEPPSSDPVSYREIAEVHRATGLDTADDVTAWREQQRPEDFSPCSAPESGPDQARGTVDEIVLRRGSTRRFDPDARVGEAAIRWAVDVALADVPGELAPRGRTPVRAAVAAHGVEGAAPGLYRVDPHSWERIGDQTRRQTAHQCLDQPLGGSSVATVFFCCDLESLVESVGARAYRSAELAAGIAAERLQLAAFALGIGGTGLTFYDDEIERAVGLDPLLVTAVGAPDYEPSPGRRPGST